MEFSIKQNPFSKKKNNADSTWMFPSNDEKMLIKKRKNWQARKTKVSIYTIAHAFQKFPSTICKGRKHHRKFGVWILTEKARREPWSTFSTNSRMFQNTDPHGSEKFSTSSSSHWRWTFLPAAIVPIQENLTVCRGNTLITHNTNRPSLHLLK